MTHEGESLVLMGQENESSPRRRRAQARERPQGFIWCPDTILLKPFQGKRIS